jgi:hypothetical protein
LTKHYKLYGIYEYSLKFGVKIVRMGYKFRKTQLAWKNYKYVEKFVLKSSKGEKIWATE